VKVLFALLTIFLCLFSFSKANLIEDLKPLGFEIVTISNRMIESEVLVKMDSLNKQYAKEIEKYGCFPSIYSRGLFRNMPGIRYYRPVGCIYVSGIHVTRFDYCLFNEYNHSIYYPNGDLKAYNNVFGSSIRNNFEPSFIMKLLFLYVLNSDVRGYHLILGFYNDIRNLYDITQKDSHAYFWFLHVKLLKELYPSLGQPINIENKTDHYKIEFNCFDGVRTIDHWIFNVYPDSISLVSKIKLKSDIDLSPSNSQWNTIDFNKLK